MLLNYGSFDVNHISTYGFVVTALIVTGLFTYSFYNIFNSTQALGNESLVNTSTVLTPSALAENTIPIPVPDPTPLPVLEPGNLQYVNVGVQTDVTSIWGTIKTWFVNAFSMRSSELSSLGPNNVNRWINNLDSVQSVSLHDSESLLTGVRSNSTVQQLIGPDDSASQISEVLSGSQVVESASNVDVISIVNNAIVDYSGYIAVGDVLVNSSTNHALVNSVNAALTIGVF
jgi:hypothetical protein